jgi:hypothetical protein
VRVDHAPGGYTPGTHRRPASAYVHVLDGAVRMGLDHERPRVLGAGDSLYEAPGRVRSVSANASDTASASRLAFFVLQKASGPLWSTPDAQTGRAGRTPPGAASFEATTRAGQQRRSPRESVATQRSTRLADPHVTAGGTCSSPVRWWCQVCRRRLDLEFPRFAGHGWASV